MFSPSRAKEVMVMERDSRTSPWVRIRPFLAIVAV